MKPQFRSGTKKAIDAIAKSLNLPYETGMQDFPYEVAQATDIDKYLAHYEGLIDTDVQFVLMQAIIQAIEDQANDALFLRYCNRITPILEKDFDIHAYTIYYWACFNNNNLDDCWTIAPIMRDIFLKKGLSQAEIDKGKTTKPRLYVDFNELIEDDLVLLSQSDFKRNSWGEWIVLHADLPVDIYMYDENLADEREDLIASGVVEKNESPMYSHVKWNCRIDKNGIQRDFMNKKA
jgi:hypothetical protein